MTMVGRTVEIAECGRDADLQTIYEDDGRWHEDDGCWSARVRYLCVGKSRGLTERDAILDLAKRFRAIAERLELEVAIK